MGNAEKTSQVIRIDSRELLAEGQKTVLRTQLVNRLNYANFQDRSITANFTHLTGHQSLSIPVKPQPCIGATLDCLWEDPDSIPDHMESYRLVDFCIESERRKIRFTPEIVSIGKEGICLRLPETAMVTTGRVAASYHCRDVDAQMIQHGACFSGKLRRFNALCLQVAMEARPPQTFGWMQSGAPVQVIFTSGGETLYSGECRILDVRVEGHRGIFTLEPTIDRLQRFETKEFRSQRHRLVPSPYLFFRHPFTGALVQRDVVDISGSGFSVEESTDDPMLLTGMILPSAELNFGNMYRISCRTQVVYRRPCPDGEPLDGSVRCGLALLDIGIEEHTRLLALLNQVHNRHSYVCNRVDLDALWDFFFETGFIYPQKYAFIRENKERIKETYERLYNQTSTIARHFTYQDGARILGHIAMIRFYSGAWLIHHHAGNTSASTRAGLEVLHQIGRFTYDCHRLRCIHMDYLICYFRPENKFPNRIFGRITRNIDDLAGSSIDPFAYCHWRRKETGAAALPPGWTLDETDTEDLQSIAHFYDVRSGGLMLQALDLVPERMDLSELTREYRSLGFRRDRHLFSLNLHGRIRALIAANLSDVGLNLSDLTSAVNVIVIDPEALAGPALPSALDQVAELYPVQEIPVLLYPPEYAGTLSLPVEKQYQLWVLNTGFSDHYFRHLNRLTRFAGAPDRFAKEG